jgi:hypothetical protein
MTDSADVSQKATKVVTVRLPRGDAARLELVARVEGISVNEVFRRACEQHMASLRADEEFVARAKAHIARENEIAGQLV